MKGSVDDPKPLRPSLTDTQRAILFEASQRKDRCLIAPKTLKAAATQEGRGQASEGRPRERDQSEVRNGDLATRRPASSRHKSGSDAPRAALPVPEPSHPR